MCTFLYTQKKEVHIQRDTYKSILKTTTACTSLCMCICSGIKGGTLRGSQFLSYDDKMASCVYKIMWLLCAV